MLQHNQLTSFLATAPRKARQVCEAFENVEDRPGDDDDVVDVLQEDHHHSRVPNSLAGKSEFRQGRYQHF